MPAERLPVRKVRAVLRLKHACGVSERVIARSIGVSRSTVAEYLRRAAVTGLTWPLPTGLDDAILDRLVHNAHRLVLKGESIRKITAQRDGLDVATAT